MIRLAWNTGGPRVNNNFVAVRASLDETLAESALLALGTLL